MPSKYQFDTEYQGRFARVLQLIRIDPVLLFGLLMLTLAGLGILYSAGDQSAELMQKQVVRLSIAFLVMLVAAQVSPHQLYLWTPWVFLVGVILLLMVFFAGDVGDDHGLGRVDLQLDQCLVEGLDPRDHEHRRDPGAPSATSARRAATTRRPGQRADRHSGHRSR